MGGQQETERERACLEEVTTYLTQQGRQAVAGTRREDDPPDYDLMIDDVEYALEVTTLPDSDPDLGTFVTTLTNRMAALASRIEARARAPRVRRRWRKREVPFGGGESNGDYVHVLDTRGCGWFGDCGPEKRRTEPGQGWTGEIGAKALVETDRALDLGEDSSPLSMLYPQASATGTKGMPPFRPRLPASAIRRDEARLARAIALSSIAVTL